MIPKFNLETLSDVELEVLHSALENLRHITHLVCLKNPKDKQESWTLKQCFPEYQKLCGEMEVAIEIEYHRRENALIEENRKELEREKQIEQERIDNAITYHGSVDAICPICDKVATECECYPDSDRLMYWRQDNG